MRKILPWPERCSFRDSFTIVPKSCAYCSTLKAGPAGLRSYFESGGGWGLTNDSKWGAENTFSQ